MNGLNKSQLAQTFTTGATAYDSARPTYPLETREIITSGLGASLSILEVGCGTGQATALFAPIAKRLDAIDPSDDMIGVVRRKFAEESHVSFTASPFETAQLAPIRYDLVLSAQAFHWLDLEVAIPKACAALRAGGRLALMWNYLDFEGLGLLRALLPAILEAVPHFSRWPDSSHECFERYAQEWHDALAKPGLFSTPVQSVVASEWHQTRAGFCAWLNTLSWMKALDAAKLQALNSHLDEMLAGEPDDLCLPLRTLVIGADKPASRI